ncbi:MAG: peptidase S15 [Mesorhizobium amorphae]|nr:MAG: peptidase S15 [Mesorhizobium amorphae]
MTSAPFRVVEHAPIALSDGIVLSAQLWLPEDAEENPVPAILEYLPYRKRDGTADRDALNHRYFAAHGYASVRVDMRGSGDSEGVLEGEYLQQEQDDALEILRWIASQPWCSGAVGMIGISWGGFNGLQVAARRPPELKAVISLCSTDDRYADDVHFMGGCLLLDKFSWGSTMFSINPTPPDPALVGEKWREMWMERLEGGGLFMVEWHERQRRDAFYRHGSIAEDYSAIQCPTYLVGGWMDGYSNPIFRMLEHLECPRKGLIGPWAHKYPNFAQPGPRIGFLQECIRWWDQWLKGKDTGIMDEPMLRAWLQDTVKPQTHYAERPGRWAAETQWPSLNVEAQTLHLGAGSLSGEAGSGTLSISSPQTVGLAAGKWCPYGLEADEPGDQREEAGGSLVFDTAPLEEGLDLLGAPVLRLRVSADKPNAFVAAVLSEVLADGSATRLSYGLLNLTHRNGHVNLEALEPGRFYDVSIKLNECGQALAPGSRIRLALSNAYWPIVWPSPETATLAVDCAGTALDLPVRRPSGADAALPPFEPEANGKALEKTVLREGRSHFFVRKDIRSGEVVMERFQDSGLAEIDATGWRSGGHVERHYAIHPDDPLSAWASNSWRQEFGREGFHVAIEGTTRMHVTKTELHLTAKLDAFEAGAKVWERDWRFAIPRDHL